MDDALLMADIAAGDRAAFGRLMRAHLPRAYATAYRLLGQPQEAEEVAQEAMLRVWRHAAGFDARRAQFSTWLYRIVVNLALDRLRRAGTAPRAVPLEQAAEAADAAPDAEARLLARAQGRSVAAALAALPERQRAAVVLVHYEGLSGRDAALVLGMTPKAVESLLYRALKTLRRTMLDEDARQRSMPP